MRLSPLPLLIVALAGCSPREVPNVSLAGTVTLDSLPLKEGIIIFYSETPGAPTVSADIKDGKFEAPTIPQGKYLAAIRSKTVDTATGGPVTSDTGAPTAKAKPDPIPLIYREPSVPVDASRSNDSVKIELKSK